MLPDVLSLVLTHIEHTTSLLLTRRTCKQARDSLPLERIMGMSFAQSRLFFDHTATLVGTMAGATHATGLQIVRQGNACVLWTKRRPNAIEIAQFSHTNRWQREYLFEVSAPDSVYLWVCMGADGVLCTLAATNDPDRPLVLTTLRLSAEACVRCTTIDRELLLQQVEEIASLKPGSLLYACWGRRSFLIVLPCSEHTQKVGVLEILHAQERWEWWEVSVSAKDDTYMQLGPAHHAGRYVFIMPVGGAMLFRIDLEDDAPRPRLAHTLPELPTSVNALKVSANQQRILAYSTSDASLFSVTPAGASLLSTEKLVSFFFANDNAAVAFHRDSGTFRIYNLNNGELVRHCCLSHIPCIVTLDPQGALWTVETARESQPCMRLRRLTAHAARAS